MTACRQRCESQIEPAARKAASPCGLPQGKMPPAQVTRRNRADGDAAVAQRHCLGAALVSAPRCALVARDGGHQSAPRGNDDIRDRRRIQQVDVLGNHVPDASPFVGLVHCLWSSCAVAHRRNRNRVASEPSSRLGPVRSRVLSAAIGADTRGFLCPTCNSGRCLWPTSTAFDPRSDVLAGHAVHLQPASELQHRNTIRDGRCVGQCVEPPGRHDYADCCRAGPHRSDSELRDQKAIHATCRGGAGTTDSFRHLETIGFDDVGAPMNLGTMSFDNGILHLANWMGNVIMPTLAAVFIIIAILQFSKSQEFSHSIYGALACLLVSGLTRAFETFASQSMWNDPDLYWISIRTLIDWVANVILPVYAASQVASMALRMGIFSLVHPTSGWMRHFVTAALCLMVSGLLRLGEFFVNQGTGGIT